MALLRSSSTSTTSSEPAAETTSETNAGATQVPASGADDLIGLKVGFGLGIPLAIIQLARRTFSCVGETSASTASRLHNITRLENMKEPSMAAFRNSPWK